MNLSPLWDAVAVWVLLAALAPPPWSIWFLELVDPPHLDTSGMLP